MEGEFLFETPRTLTWVKGQSGEGTIAHEILTINKAEAVMLRLCVMPKPLVPHCLHS